MTAALFPILPLLLAADDAPAPPYPGPPPVVAVYGDSWSTGTPLGGQGELGWPALVRDRLRLSVGNDAVGGTGFVAFYNGSSIPYAVTVWPITDARVAVLFGGLNDRTADPQATRAGAVVALAAVRAAAPSAVRILVGPQWPATPPTAAILAERDALASAARAAGVTYVDAVGWFQGRPDLIGADGWHPTDAGHRLIADHLAPIIDAALAAGP